MERPSLSSQQPLATATSCGDTYIALHDMATPPPQQEPTPADKRRRSTWTPVRQASISALFRLTSSATDSRPPLTRERRARTLNDTIGARRPWVEPQRGRRATTGQLSTVFRWVTTFVGQPVDETVWCQICFENVAVSNAIALEPCGHQYCRPCFAAHLEQKMDEGDAFPVCFHPVLRDEDGENDRLFGRSTCGARVPAAAIEELCGAEVWASYAVLREHEADQTHVCECPYCFHTQPRSLPASHEAVCESCDRPFCTLHGSAHEESSCGDYEFTTVRELRIHQASTAPNAKPCPSCTASVNKTGNCNHMRCLVCMTSFCWLCGDRIDDGVLPAHYDSTGKCPCRGKQWDDVPTEPSSLSDRMLAIAWQCLVAVFCMPIAFALAMFVKVLALCCRPLRPRFGTGFGEVFADIRGICETWFRAMVTFAVFSVFRYAVLLVCMPPAFVLTYLFKMVSCVCSKPYRRFFDRDAKMVFKDLDLMFATVIFTVVCAVAVSVIVIIGVIVRAGERLLLHWFNCCTTRLSTADTVPVENDHDDDNDLEAERGHALGLPSAATPYVVIQS